MVAPPPNRLKITIKIDNSALHGAASAGQPTTSHLPFQGLRIKPQGEGEGEGQRWGSCGGIPKISDLEQGSMETDKIISLQSCI